MRHDGIFFRPEAVNLLDQGKYVEGLNAVDWNADRVQGLEETLRKSSQLGFCNATKAAAHVSHYKVGGISTIIYTLSLLQYIYSNILKV